MTAKFSSIALLAALTTAVTAQTSPKTTTSTATHHTPAAKTATTPPNIPKIVGIPKTLYALKYIDSKIGTGPIAQSTVLGASQADSTVMSYTVRYTGWLADGTKFDSSYDHTGGEPITFPQGLHRVIAGWDTGFQGMRIGGKRRLFIPYQLGYGEAGKPPVIPAKSDLIFDIELVSIADTLTQPKKPAVVPPAPASQTSPAATPAQPATLPATTQPANKPPADSTTQPATPPHPEGL